jgi:hypothetical protein
LQVRDQVPVHFHERAAGTFGFDRQLDRLFGGSNRSSLVSLLRENLGLEVKQIIDSGDKDRPGYF